MSNTRIRWITLAICSLLATFFVWLACLAAQANKQTANEAHNNTIITGNYYALTSIVVEIDRSKDLVMVEDSTGNRWQFYGAKDWQEGDCASLLMWDNGTDTILDDEVRDARYSAWALNH